MEGSELTSKFEGRTPMANIEYFDNTMKTERVAVQARAATGAEIQPSRFLFRDRLRRRSGSRKWSSAHQSTTYRRGVSRSIEMSMFSDRFTETVPLAGKTRSYREQIDRFIESVSFGRTHATERDSL
jgi:hypothetical protein